MDWSTLYPNYFTRAKSDGATSPTKSVEFADIGCGYGGLLGKCQNYELMMDYIFMSKGIKAVVYFCIFLLCTVYSIVIMKNLSRMSDGFT
jgi:hypothetical protein